MRVAQKQNFCQLSTTDSEGNIFSNTTNLRVALNRQLCVESLTQVLVIHLMRHYSTLTQTIRLENRSLTKSTQLPEVPSGRTLTHAELQQAMDYIQTHLGEDLSLVQIAKVMNLSPTYFASLFKLATGISPEALKDSLTDRKMGTECSILSPATK